MSDQLTPAAGSPQPSDDSRRTFMKQAGGLPGFTLAGPLAGPAEHLTGYSPVVEGLSEVTLRLNGQARTLRLEPRTTLLDALREYADLTGTKKGCDHGQCGACTMHVDGRRINSCLTLAVMNRGKDITTIEGLERADNYLC